MLSKELEAVALLHSVRRGRPWAAGPMDIPRFTGTRRRAEALAGQAAVDVGGPPAWPKQLRRGEGPSVEAFGMISESCSRIAGPRGNVKLLRCRLENGWQLPCCWLPHLTASVNHTANITKIHHAMVIAVHCRIPLICGLASGASLRQLRPKPHPRDPRNFVRDSVLLDQAAKPYPKEHKPYCWDCHQQKDDAWEHRNL